MSWISRDGQLLLAAKTVRSFGYGLLSVLLGLYLELVGFAPTAVGTILTLALVGSALLTSVMAAYADRIGRRRTLMLSTGLMIVAGLVFAFSRNPWVLAMAALTGTVSATSGEVGAFETVEQAALPQTTRSERRNRAFGWYHTLGALAVAIGSLAAGVPSWMHNQIGVETLTAYRLMFGGYAGLSALSLLCFLPLTEAVELGTANAAAKGSILPLRRSRRTVAKLAALFGIDALGGGFVIQSMLVYWFAFRFDVGGELLAPVFLGVNLLKAVSYPLAMKLADRIGLINTMVFTHLPSNVLLMLIPLMPDLRLATFFLLGRHLLAQMDVPARGSYVVAIVDPEERTAATGVTTLVRTGAQAVGPVLAGVGLQLGSMAAPFLLGGGLKIVYDLALYWNFRTIRAPEEEPSERRRK